MASLEQLEGLPRALIITAENDVLRDEGEAYGRKLIEAGVEVVAARYNATIHDVVMLNALADVFCVARPTDNGESPWAIGGSVKKLKSCRTSPMALELQR